MDRSPIRNRIDAMDRPESGQADQAMDHGSSVGVLIATGIALMLLGAFILSRPTDMPVGVPVVHQQILDRPR